MHCTKVGFWAYRSKLSYRCINIFVRETLRNVSCLSTSYARILIQYSFANLSDTKMTTEWKWNCLWLEVIFFFSFMFVLLQITITMHNNDCLYSPCSPCGLRLEQIWRYRCSTQTKQLLGQGFNNAMTLFPTEREARAKHERSEMRERKGRGREDEAEWGRRRVWEKGESRGGRW